MATAGGPEELFGVNHPTPEQERDFTRAAAADTWVENMFEWYETREKKRP